MRNHVCVVGLKSYKHPFKAVRDAEGVLNRKQAYTMETVIVVYNLIPIEL